MSVSGSSTASSFITLYNTPSISIQIDTNNNKDAMIANNIITITGSVYNVDNTIVYGYLLIPLTLI